MNNPVITLLAVAALASTLPAGAETFYDQARVIDVQPVYKLRQLPVQVEKCGFEQPATAASVDPRSLGDARAVDPGIDLFGAMRRETELRAPPEKVYRCRTVTQTHSTKELSGYRVRYEYAGHIHERHMQERPGDTIEVAITMGTEGGSTRVARWR
jgi:hypothetical protein